MELKVCPNPRASASAAEFNVSHARRESSSKALFEPLEMLKYGWDFPFAHRPAEHCSHLGLLPPRSTRLAFPGPSPARCPRSPLPDSRLGLPHHGAAPAPAAQIWHQRNLFRRNLSVRFLVLENRTHKLMETHLRHPHGQQPRDSPVQTHGQEACIKLENGILSSQNQGEEKSNLLKAGKCLDTFCC